MAKTEEIAGKFLGKKVEGKSIYDPSFLVAVPRQENRTYLGIDETNCPDGFDTWYGYEFTALTDSGHPINRAIKIVYPCTNPSIVESKSLKLYLNSFAMTKLGSTFEEVLAKAKQMIVDDLSKALETNVQVSFLDRKSDRKNIFGYFDDIYEGMNGNEFEVTEYHENPGLLKVREGDGGKMKMFVFNSLRSNCKITAQPDHGDIFIAYSSKKEIDKESLVKYLCSFRGENHFHEEIDSCCFARLRAILDPEDPLMVTALYTRRGGIDINPCRYQNLEKLSPVLQEDIKCLAEPDLFTRYEFNVKQ